LHFLWPRLQFGAAAVVIWQMNGLFLAKAKCFPINFYISLLSLSHPGVRSLPIVIGIANSSVHNLMYPNVPQV